MPFLRAVIASLGMTWAFLPTGASAAAQGIVLTGGSLTLDFADPSIGGNSTTLDRLDSLTWSGGSGALAGQNLVANAGPGGCASDPVEFFGQSYGEPEQTTPGIVIAGAMATLSNQTATSMTSTTTGFLACSCGSNSAADAASVTTYNVFPAGDPNVNEVRVSRTIEFNSSTPVFSGHGVRGYVARLPIGTYGTVLIPNAAGTAINTMQAINCSNDCEVTDWNGKWFADDNGSGTGMVVFRDVSSTSPALLAVNNDGLSASNLTSIILIQPTGGWKAPVTETEWLCFYDPTTWTAADQLAGRLPAGCAQHAIASSPESSIAFAPVLSATPGSVATSNTVQMTGIPAGTPISISGGEYSINGGAYTSAAGTVNNGDYVTVQATASANNCATTLATLSIGGVKTQFSVTTPASGSTSLSLGISPGTIAPGQQALLTWSTANASNCTASGAWSGSEATSGTDSVTSSTLGLLAYTLSCSGVSTANATVDLLVAAAATPAPTVTLTATPSSGTVGSVSILTWSSTNATACTASGAWSGSEPVSGTNSQLAYAVGTRSFTLTCTGAGGSAQATAVITTVAPVTPAPTVTITVSPTSVTVGAAATLNWSSTNATACTASGAWSGAEPVSGTATETPTAAGAQVFTLTCTGAGGSAHAAATLTALAPVTPAPTVTIAVNPTSVTVGASAALSWSSTNATACTASGAWSGGEALSGTANETPAIAGTELFTLTCTGAGGSANASATLTANALPVVSSTSSGKIGGGGAFDIVSLAGLLLLAAWVRRPQRPIRVIKKFDSLSRAAIRSFVIGVGGCALLAAALPGHAADDFGFDWQRSYVGLRAGESIYQPTSNTLRGAGGPYAGEIQSLAVSAHQFGGVIYAGVPVWKNLSLEIGYAQIGQFPLSLTALGTHVDALAQSVVDGAPAAGHGMTFGFALPVDITSRLSVEPRFAALAYQSKQSITTSDATLRHDSTGVGFDAGVVFSLRVAGPIYLGAGVDCFHEDHACNALLVSGQVEYRFGRRGDR
jgi:hypothetical protein